jgi:hypothetical protein
LCTTTPSTYLEYLISHGGKQERMRGKGWKQECRLMAGKRKQECGLMAGKRERVHGKGFGTESLVCRVGRARHWSRMRKPA